MRESCDAVIGHQLPVLAEIIRPPGKLLHVELEATVATLKLHENLEAGSHDLLSDAVAGYDGDAVSSHWIPLVAGGRDEFRPRDNIGFNFVKKAVASRHPLITNTAWRAGLALHSRVKVGRSVPSSGRESLPGLDTFWPACLAARFHASRAGSRNVFAALNLGGRAAGGDAPARHDHQPAGDIGYLKDFQPGAPFVEPAVRYSAHGELNTTLRMQYAYKTIGGYRLYVQDL